MFTALQLQFFMVQGVNYLVITVKIKCKNPQYHKYKALTMVRVNSSVYFSCVSPYVTKNVSVRRWSFRDSRESRELQSLDQRLGSCNVSSRSRLGQNFKLLGLVSVSETWVSGFVSVSAQKISCTSQRTTFGLSTLFCFRTDGQTDTGRTGKTGKAAYLLLPHHKNLYSAGSFAYSEAPLNGQLWDIVMQASF